MACVLEEAAAAKLGRTGGVPREKVPDLVDLIVVLGGDGTLLSIAHVAARRGVPVMGVNLGSLGFLTEVPLQEMALALDALFEGRAGLVNPRMIIEARFNGADRAKPLPERPRHQQGRPGPDDPSPALDRRPRSRDDTVRRPDRGYSHRFDGLFPLGGRTHPPAGHPRLPPDAHLPPHPDASGRSSSRPPRKSGSSS